MARRGNRSGNLRISSPTPSPLSHLTPLTYCKLLWIRASVKCKCNATGHNQMFNLASKTHVVPASDTEQSSLQTHTQHYTPVLTHNTTLHTHTQHYTPALTHNTTHLYSHTTLHTCTHTQHYTCTRYTHSRYLTHRHTTHTQTRV